MARMYSKAWAKEVVGSIIADEKAQAEAARREDCVIRGVCPRHPNVRISTGGGFPMYDGICGSCEMEMAVDGEHDPESCSCGFAPGDGVNPDCNDPEGCGYWKKF